MRFRTKLMPMFRKATLSFIFSVLCVAGILGQATDNGSISGTVTDPEGAIIPGATVTAVNLGTGAKRTVITGSRGEWVISVLPPGEYEVKASFAGFQEAIQRVLVTVSSTKSLTLTMGIALDESVVDVVSERDALVNPDSSATVSSSVTGRGLETAPLVNRTPFGRLALDTSAGGDIADPTSNSNGNPEISVNGTRTTSQGVQFNGVDATNISGTGSLTESISPAPETVQEVSFLSNLYDASLGRNGGGSIQLVTKSGSNRFSGSAYVYVQNETFNANDFSSIETVLTDNVPEGLRRPYHRWAFEKGQNLLLWKLSENQR